MVKKIKDIVYDVNDVIVVLIIIALAALVVWNRMEVILAYPTTGDTGFFVSQSGQDHEKPNNADGNGNEAATAVTNGSIVASTDGGTDNPDYTDITGDGADQGIIPDPGDTGTDSPPETVPPAADTSQPAATDEYPFSIYVAYGETASEIGQKLLEGGIIKSKDEFYEAIRAAQAERKLLAGTFIIPQKSTPADVVRILTGG